MNRRVQAAADRSPSRAGARSETFRQWRKTKWHWPHRPERKKRRRQPPPQKM